MCASLCSALERQCSACLRDSLYLFLSGPTLFPLTMATKKNRMGTCRLATWPGISKPQAAGTESRLTEKV